MITGQLQRPQCPYSQQPRSTHYQRTSYVYAVRKAFCPDLSMLEGHQQQNTTCFVLMHFRNALTRTTRPVTFIFKTSTFRQLKTNISCLLCQQATLPGIIYLGKHQPQNKTHFIIMSSTNIFVLHM